jgi:CRP-like cAMP-binding protein
MHESLITYIKKHSTTPLTETEIEVIKEVCTPKKLRKRQYFLQEGEVCIRHAFIIKGAMRQYTVDEEGVEHIVRLRIENSWAADRESWANLTPTIYNIDAWEDCNLLLLTKADFLNRLIAIPAFNEMTQKATEDIVLFLQNRLSMLALSAEERYSELIKTTPDFLQRFPQHIIASYLGITKETLSRVRSHALKK